MRWSGQTLLDPRGYRSDGWDGKRKLRQMESRGRIRLPDSQNDLPDLLLRLAGARSTNASTPNPTNPSRKTEAQSPVIQRTDGIEVHYPWSNPQAFRKTSGRISEPTGVRRSSFPNEQGPDQLILGPAPPYVLALELAFEIKCPCRDLPRPAASADWHGRPKPTVRPPANTATDGGPPPTPLPSGRTRSVRAAARRVGGRGPVHRGGAPSRRA